MSRPASAACGSARTSTTTRTTSTALSQPFAGWRVRELEPASPQPKGDERKEVEDDRAKSALAGAAARGLGAHPRDAPYVDPGRRQSAAGVQPVHEPLVASAALRDRARAYDVTHSLRGRNIRNRVRFHRAQPAHPEE